MWGRAVQKTWGLSIMATSEDTEQAVRLDAFRRSGGRWGRRRVVDLHPTVGDAHLAADRGHIVGVVFAAVVFTGGAARQGERHEREKRERFGHAGLRIRGR